MALTAFSSRTLHSGCSLATSDGHVDVDVDVDVDAMARTESRPGNQKTMNTEIAEYDSTCPHLPPSLARRIISDFYYF